MGGLQVTATLVLEASLAVTEIGAVGTEKKSDESNINK